MKSPALDDEERGSFATGSGMPELQDPRHGGIRMDREGEREAGVPVLHFEYGM